MTAEEEFEAWWSRNHNFVPKNEPDNEAYLVGKECWLASREATYKKCLSIAKNLTVQVGDGPVVHADYMWIADEIEREFGGKP